METPPCGGMIIDILCYKCRNQKTEAYALTYHKLQGSALSNYSIIAWYIIKHSGKLCKHTLYTQYFVYNHTLYTHILLMI